MIVLGIDPGKDGGLVALNENREVIFKEVMPSDPMNIYAVLREFKKNYTDFFIFLESVGPRPKNGIKGIHTFAYHAGQIDMIIQILKIRHEFVHPHIWCKYMHAGTSGDRPKEKSKQAVKRLFPDENLLKPNSTRARTIHEGLMDALLIAEFGLRKLTSLGKPVKDKE